MKLLHVSPTWWPAMRYGGPIVSIRALCAGLVQAGHAVSVASTNVDGDGVSGVPLDRAWNDQGVCIHSFASGWGRRSYFSLPMRRYLAQHVPDFDLLHTHSVFLWPTWQAARCARRADRPYVLSPRGMLVPELVRAKSQLPKKIWLRWFERSNLRHAAAIHVTSAVERDDLMRMNLGELPRVEIIPNGVDVPERLPVQRKPAQILFVGRLSWKKRLEVLLDAMAQVPDASLLLAGPDGEGLSDALRARAAALGISARVHFTGAIDADRRNVLLAESTLLVLPSISENFGNTAAEAMASACPVLVTAGVGVAEHVRAAGCGRVVDESVGSLAMTMRGMIDTPAETQAMGERGREYAIAALSWPAVAMRMQSLYEEILRQKR